MKKLTNFFCNQFQTIEALLTSSDVNNSISVLIVVVEVGVVVAVVVVVVVGVVVVVVVVDLISEDFFNIHIKCKKIMSILHMFSTFSSNAVSMHCHALPHQCTTTHCLIKKLFTSSELYSYTLTCNEYTDL